MNPELPNILQPLYTSTTRRRLVKHRHKTRPNYQYIPIVDGAATSKQKINMATAGEDEDHGKYVYFTTKRGRRQKILRTKYEQQQQRTNHTNNVKKKTV